MSKTEKLNEEQVFKQELDDEELIAVTGGTGEEESDTCIDSFYRIREEDDCAASVENGSWCGNNDFCNISAVVYLCYNTFLTEEECIIAAWD